MALILRTLMLLFVAAPLLAQPPAPIPTPEKSTSTPAKTADEALPPQMQKAMPTARPAPAVTSADRADAYKGLITTLHDSGENKTALTQLQNMPTELLAQLSLDPDFLVASAGIYSSVGENGYALRLLDSAVERYMLQRKPVPLGIRIQACYLLLESGDDYALHSRLFFVTQIAEREDSLTPEQSGQLNDLWIFFALRRAGEENSAGNRRAALRILITAYETYPESVLIKRSLAGSYLNAGDAKTALQLYKEVGLADASPADYQGAIGAAFAAGDRRNAEKWLRLLLEKEPKDPAVLTLAAKFEQARGNRKLAAHYYQSALENMPKEKRALTIPSSLRDEAPGPAKPSQSPLTTLASVTDPSAASVAINNSSATTGARSYLPGEQATSRLMPIFIPQRHTAAAAPALSVASPGSPSPASSPVVRTRPTLRSRHSATDPGKADVAHKGQVLYQFPSPGTARLGDYDPTR